MLLFWLFRRLRRSEVSRGTDCEGRQHLSDTLVAMKKKNWRNIQHRVVGDLTNCDFVMNLCIWIGVYLGLTTEMLEFVIAVLR